MSRKLPYLGYPTNPDREYPGGPYDINATDDDYVTIALQILQSVIDTKLSSTDLDSSVASQITNILSSTRAALDSLYASPANLINESEKGAPGGVATLNNVGKIPGTQLALASVAFSGSASDITTGTLPSSVLPPSSVSGSNTFVVANQTGMLALSAIQGDVAVRTDLNESFRLAATPASTLSNWIEIPAAGAVTSVAGRAGNVVLAKGDVGLTSVDNTADTAKPVSTPQQTALNLKANLAGPTFTGHVTVPTPTTTTDAVPKAYADTKAPLDTPTFTGVVSGVTKSMVGLANVDNTSDVNKPVSTAQAAATADMAKSKAGVGGFILIRDGIDTATGDPKELILVADTSGGSSSGGGTAFPPGIDVIGGQVACTWGDPGMLIIPASADTESSGNVYVAVANNRLSARFTMQDVVLNKVTWQACDGSTAGVSGTIGIAKPDGTILRQATTNLSASPVTAGTGDTMVWTLNGATGALNAPLTDTDLNVGDELIIFTQHASGTVRYAARGLANMVNPDTVSRPSGGSLHRSGVLASAPTVASPLTFTTGYTKKPCPFFLFTRTI